MNNTNILNYKGYYTKVEYSVEDNILYGKIEGINDFVNFECENIADVEKEFHLAVDDYLTYCEDIGQEPEKTYKGIFNVRISPDLHKKSALEAFKQDITLNQYVSNALEMAINKDDVKTVYIPVVIEKDKITLSGYNKSNSKFNDFITLGSPIKSKGVLKYGAH